MANMPTFQFQPQAVAPVSGASGAAPSLGISGGNATAGVIGPSRYGSITPGAGSQIPEFLDKLVAPKLEALRQQKFYAGFAKARSDATMDEIAEESPWFSRLFGPTPYELGATTFATQKASADMESEFIRQLPTLRTKSPDEIGADLNAISQSQMTGNFYTDAVIQKAVMDRSGPMLEAHAKARYAWQQEELVKGQNGMMLSAGEALHTSLANSAMQGKDHPNQLLDPETTKERQRLFLQSFQAVDGQDPTSYMQNVITTTEQLADKGQWYAVETLRESGLFAQLPPDDREKLENRLDRASTKYQANLANGPLMKPIAQFFAGVEAGAYSPEQTANGLHEINASYTAMTGDTRPLYDQDETIGAVKTAGGLVYKALERQWTKNEAARTKAQTAAEKEMAEARTAAAYAHGAATNTLGILTNLPKADQPMAEAAFLATINDPAILPDRVVGNFAAKVPWVSPKLKDQLRKRVQLSAGEEFTDGFAKEYETWKSIRYHVIDNGGTQDRTSGVAAAIEYYGPLNTGMQQFDDMVRSGVQPEIAYRRALGNAASYGAGDMRGADSKATRAARDELQSVVESENPSWWQLGKKSMGSSAQNVVVNIVSRYYAQVRQNDPAMSDTEVAHQAMKLAKVNGLEIAGGYAWQNMRGQKPISAEVNMHPDVFNTLFDESLTAKFRKSGMSIGEDTSINIIRLGNDADGPRLFATASKDGVQKTIAITGKDLRALREREAKEDLNPTQPTTTPFKAGGRNTN